MKWKFVGLALVISVAMLVIARTNSRGRSEHIVKTIDRVTFDLHTLPKIEETKRDTLRVTVTGLKKSDRVLLRFVVRNSQGQDTVFSSQVLQDWGSGTYRAELLGGTKGGRREYVIDAIDSTNQTIARLLDQHGKPLATRFIGAVPPVVLVAHLVFIFGTVFFVAMGALYGWRLLKGEETVRQMAFYFFWATVSCFLGGYPFGFAMNYYAFGGLWEGVPFGTDATDNKTQLILVYVLFASVVAAGHYGKGMLGRSVFSRKTLGNIGLLAVPVMLFIYLIPHSIQFSAGLTYGFCYAFTGIIVLWYLVGFFRTKPVGAVIEEHPVKQKAGSGK